MLFDVICLSAALGYALPQDDINIHDLAGRLNPRPRLARGTRRILGASGELFTEQEWKAAAQRLARRLLRTLASRDLASPDADGNFEPLRSLLSFAPSVLALDCTVPTGRPVHRAAWTVVIRVLGRLHPSGVARISLPWLDARRFATLAREAHGAFLGGRASGERPGPSGRRLAVDTRLVTAVQKAMRTKVRPAFIAQYVFYTREGDYFWPHTDSLRVYVNVFICLEHVMPEGQTRASAFVGYHEDGTVERFELHTGDIIAAHTQGLVHAREPLAKGERVTLLAVAMRAADGTGGGNMRPAGGAKPATRRRPGATRRRGSR